MQAGGLGMVALGLAQLTTRRLAPHPRWQHRLHGVVVVHRRRDRCHPCRLPRLLHLRHYLPSFYYLLITAGKNAWLLWQAFFIGIYFVDAALMFNTVRRPLNAIPATT